MFIATLLKGCRFSNLCKAATGNRTNFYWAMILLYISSTETFCHTKIWYSLKIYINILSFWHRKLYIETWYISTFFLSDFVFEQMSQNMYQKISKTIYNIKIWYGSKFFLPNFFEKFCPKIYIRKYLKHFST